MFESDDFDQILSQFDFPGCSTKETNNSNEDVSSKVNGEEIQESPLKFVNTSSSPLKSFKKKEEEVPLLPCPSNVRQNGLMSNKVTSKEIQQSPLKIVNISSTPQKLLVKKNEERIETCSMDVRQNSPENISPKHTKRKMIYSYFDHNAKRKFPGPAGLLSGNFEESKDETICHMELFSQDVDLSDNYFGEKFDTEIWQKVLEDIQTSNLGVIHTIKEVKQRALAGHLRRRKAQVVTGFVETVDRSATDPLITLRDTTGCIKCTLHRDAWSEFAPYIASEFCALILWKPTVLTTGTAFKKHYLNITLSNIHSIYSSAVLREEAESKPLPDGYQLEHNDNITVIRTRQTNFDKDTFCNETSNDTSDLLDDLDNIFTDDLF